MVTGAMGLTTNLVAMVMSHFLDSIFFAPRKQCLCPQQLIPVRLNSPTSFSTTTFCSLTKPLCDREILARPSDYDRRLTILPFSPRFASAKKCSNEGRALMQLDFQQYLMKLEKLTDIR